MGIFAKRAVDAAPARLGCEIGLRRERLLNSDGAILLPRDVGEATHEEASPIAASPSVSGHCENSARLHAGAEHVLEMISRIGADRERNAQPRRLGHLLQRVVLGGERARIAAEAGDEAVDANVANEFAGGDGIVAGSNSGAAHRADAARGAVHHHAGFFLESHPAHEVARADARERRQSSYGSRTPFLLRSLKVSPA